MGAIHSMSCATSYTPPSPLTCCTGLIQDRHLPGGKGAAMSVRYARFPFPTYLVLTDHSIVFYKLE